MSRYKNVKFVLIAPDELKLPDYVKEEYLSNQKYVETTSLEDALADLDILYMTRIQGERFADKAEYERLKDSFILTKEKLVSAKKDLTIMHPLPRVNEINVDVDEDERAKYFEQAANGRYIRMALILKLLAEKGENEKSESYAHDDSLVCQNPHCITKTERGIKLLYKNGACIYCDQKAAKK